MTQPTVHSGRRGRRTDANGVVLAALRSPIGRLFGSKVCALRFVGRRTGDTITLPVEYTRTDLRVDILAGRGDTKTWWRNFSAPRQVDVWLDGRWHSGTGTVQRFGHPDRAAALTTYRATHPRVPAETDDPVVTITLDTITLDTEARPAAGSRSLWLSWFCSVTLGEWLGFAAPAIVGAATAHATTAVAVPSLLLAGAVEGAALGWFQARVLRRALPRLSTFRWTAATACAATLAWAIGLAPSTIGTDLGTWPPGVLIPIVGICALVLLMTIGTAQWLVLRTHVPRAGRWIWATVLAWTVAIGLFTAVATPLWQPGQSIVTIGLIGALGGLVMAATFAAISGMFLLHISKAEKPAAPARPVVPDRQRKTRQ